MDADKRGQLARIMAPELVLFYGIGIFFMSLKIEKGDFIHERKT